MSWLLKETALRMYPDRVSVKMYCWECSVYILVSLTVLWCCAKTDLLSQFLNSECNDGTSFGSDLCWGRLFYSEHSQSAISHCFHDVYWVMMINFRVWIVMSQSTPTCTIWSEFNVQCICPMHTVMMTFSFGSEWIDVNYPTCSDIVCLSKKFNESFNFPLWFWYQTPKWSLYYCYYSKCLVIT